MLDLLVRRPGSRAADRNRRGKIVVMTAFLMVVMLGMVAFSVDVGYMAVTRTEMQICTDAAALAGASALVQGQDNARAVALSYLAKNKVAGQTLGASNATIDLGTWNETTRSFTVSKSWSAVNTNPEASNCCPRGRFSCHELSASK